MVYYYRGREGIQPTQTKGKTMSASISTDTKITEYLIDEATLDAAAAMHNCLESKYRVEIANIPAEAMDLIRKAAAITMAVQA